MKSWLQYLALALCQFALVSSVFMLTGVLQPLSQHFAVSIGEAALAISLFSIFYALSAPFLTLLTAHLAPKLVLLGMLAIFIIANVATTLTTSFEALLGLRILAACADGLFAATANAFAATTAQPQQRGRALAVVNSGVTLALLIGVPAATWLAGEFGWRATFYFVASVAAIGGILLALLLPASVKLPSQSLSQRLFVIRTPRLAPTLAVTAISYTGLFVVYNFSQPLMARAGLAEAVSTPHMLMLFGVGALAGNLLGGWFNDIVGAAKTVVCSLIALGVVLLGIDLFLASAASAYVFYFVVGLTHYLALSPIQHRVAALAPENTGGAMALNAAAAYVGVAAAAQIGAVVLGQGDGVLAIGVMGALLKLAALLVFVWSIRPVSRGQGFGST